MSKLNEIMPSGKVELDGVNGVFNVVNVFDIVFVWNEKKKWWQLWRIFNDMSHSNISAFKEVREGIEKLRCQGQFIIMDGNAYYVLWNDSVEYCILKRVSINNI